MTTSGSGVDATNLPRDALGGEMTTSGSGVDATNATR